MRRFWRRFRWFWASWIGGVATCGLVALAIAAAVVFGGIYNVGADSPHPSVVAWAVHHTMTSSVSKRANSDGSEQPIDSAMLIEGAKVYEAHCIACHGGPGVARAPWAAAMLPTPPFLVGSSRRWSRAEVDEIVTHGVKMTGMPAWGHVLPRREVQAVAALCMAMSELSAPQFTALRQAARSQPTTPLDAAGPAASLAPQPLGQTQPLARAVRPEPAIGVKAVS